MCFVTGGSEVNTQSCENHIAVLKKVRGVCSGQLDDGVSKELDDVIKSLEEVKNRRPDAEAVEKLRMRVLQVIAIVVSIVTNIDDWMK